MATELRAPMGRPASASHTIVRPANTTLRKAGFLPGSIESLTCPAGHHIRDTWIILREQIVRCQHRPQRGGAPCGALMWVLMLENGGALVAEIHHADVQALKQHGKCIERLRYLGQPIWPTLDDASAADAD